MSNEQTKTPTPGEIWYDRFHDLWPTTPATWYYLPDEVKEIYEKCASAVISHVLQGAKWVLVDHPAKQGDQYFSHTLQKWLPVNLHVMQPSCPLRRLISLPSSVRPEGKPEGPSTTPPVSSVGAGADVPACMTCYGAGGSLFGGPCKECGNLPSAEPVVEERPDSIWKTKSDPHLINDEQDLPPLDAAHSGPAWEHYRNELGRVRAHADRVESERDQLRKELESLRRKTDNRGVLSVTEEDETYREKCWKSMYSSMFQDLAEHRKKVSALTTENAALKEELSRDERTDVQSAINLHRESYLKADSDLRRLAIHAQTLEDHIRKQNERSERLEAELTRLRSQFRWTPVSERMPTEKDANHEGCVWMWDQDEETFPAHPIQEIHWSNVEPRRHGTILWMSPIPLPEPSPETEEQKKAAWLASLPEQHRSTLGWYKLIDAAWEDVKSAGGQA